ncbi:MAG: universal stress protein [Verrucomicrobiaceae bacterium]|nr:MAG: universal stress protein [Verrucomicrobiaceae bacterium]
MLNMNPYKYSRIAMNKLLDGKRILVVNDFSAASAEALVVGVSLAQRDHAQLIVINVEEPRRPIDWSMVNGSPVAKAGEQLEERLQRTRSRISEFICATLETDDENEVCGLRIEAAIGDPTTQIVMAAFDNQVDLIVIADHRERDQAGGHFGRICDMVARYASCSVLVVRNNRSELDLPPVNLSRRVQVT